MDPGPRKSPPIEPPGGGDKKIGDLLAEQTILVAGLGMGKEQIIDSLISMLCAAKGLSNRLELAARINERERGIGTTMDTGLSLPHARIAALGELAAALALIPSGVSDFRQPATVIRLIFLFLSPDRQAFHAQHLHVLRKAALFFKTDFIETLNRSKTPAEALRLIRSIEP